MENEMNYTEDQKKYEGELNEINKRLTAIDDERDRLVRVGVRIEGALAYINGKLKELADDAAKSAAAEPVKESAAA
jgi:predicted nuclease with TOPRIM domain